MGYDMYMESEVETQPDLEGLEFPEGFEKWKIWKEGVEARDAYYRLNIWGMSTMRELLYEGGCLAVDIPFDYDDPDAIERDTGGVLPAYKVGSNDGWLVSPAECMATALIWFEGGGREKARPRANAWATVWTAEDGDPYTEEQLLEFADDFVRWIGVAAGRGGFRVS